MDITFLVIILIIGLISYIYLSIGIILFTILFKKKLQVGDKTRTMLLIGAAIAFWLFLSNGYYGALFFIPSHWGEIGEDGIWISVRDTLSRILGGLTLWLIMTKNKHHIKEI
jgi:hypothetical protein